MRFALNIQKCRRVLINRKRPLRIKGDEVYDKHKSKFRNTTDICNVRIPYDKYIRMAGLKTFFRSEGNFAAVKKGATAPFLTGGKKMNARNISRKTIIRHLQIYNNAS